MQFIILYSIVPTFIARPYTCLIPECSTDVGADSYLHVHVPRAEGDGQPSGTKVGTLLVSTQCGVFFLSRITGCSSHLSLDFYTAFVWLQTYMQMSSSRLSFPFPRNGHSVVKVKLNLCRLAYCLECILYDMIIYGYEPMGHMGGEPATSNNNHCGVSCLHRSRQRTELRGDTGPQPGRAHW